LWLAGIDLRLTILAVPPVLPLIHRDLALDEKAVAALTGLPVLIFCVAAIPGSLLIVRIGARRALVAGLILTALGSACRGIGPSTPMLFAMTFVMGAGVAIMQPALPSPVGNCCRNAAGLATAVYAKGLLISEAVAAALTLPLVLPLAGGSWELAFALWSVPVLLTAALLVVATRRRTEPLGKSGMLWWPDLKSRTTWGLGVLSGGGAAVYFGANAFIPDFLQAHGDTDLIGPCLTALNMAQLPSSLLILLFARRLTGRKIPLMAAGIGCLVASALFAIGTPFAEIAGATAFGASASFSLILALALPPLVAEPGEVARLAGGMLTIGHALGFLLPLVGGIVWDATGTSASAFLPVILGTVVQLLGVAVLSRGEARRGRPKALV